MKIKFLSSLGFASVVIVNFTACTGTGGNFSSIDRVDPVTHAKNQSILLKRFNEIMAAASPTSNYWGSPPPANYKKMVERMLRSNELKEGDFTFEWKEEPYRELFKFGASLSNPKGNYEPYRSPTVGAKPLWLTCVYGSIPTWSRETYIQQGGRYHSGSVSTFQKEGRLYNTVCVAWQDGKAYAFGERNRGGPDDDVYPDYGDNWQFLNPNNMYALPLKASPNGEWDKPQN